MLVFVEMECNALVAMTEEGDDIILSQELVKSWVTFQCPQGTNVTELGGGIRIEVKQSAPSGSKELLPRISRFDRPEKGDSSGDSKFWNKN